MTLDAGLALTARVRDGAAWVMTRAQHISIHHDRIEGYARELVATSPLVTALDVGNHFIDAASPAKTAAYVLLLDSINFGSGAFHIAQRDGIDLEYHVVAQGLKNAFVQGVLDENCASWLRVNAQKCHEFFAIPQSAHPALDNLMMQFSTHIHLTAECVARDFVSVANMLADYRSRGPELLHMIARWPHFKDVTTYAGREIAIMKRAQIALADLELGISPDAAAGWFGGLEHLTCFADNMVPHVLRADGIITYDADLAAMIDAGMLIDSGSEMEAELRCAAIHVVELMRQSLGGSHTSVNLDHMLWHRGYIEGFTTLKPHRTLSHWY